MLKKTGLSHPITSRANMIASLFEGADGVITKFFFFSHVLKIYVQNPITAQAIANIIKPQHKLGKLVLDVKVYAADGKTKSGKFRYKEVTPVEITGSANVAGEFLTAFNSNLNFYEITKAKDPCGVTWYFVLMMPEACQYLNDDIQNPWSYTSVLPEDIVKIAFKHKGVQISTMPISRMLNDK